MYVVRRVVEDLGEVRGGKPPLRVPFYERVGAAVVDAGKRNERTCPPYL
jgi:hypothetical protein